MSFEFLILLALFTLLPLIEQWWRRYRETRERARRRTSAPPAPPLPPPFPRVPPGHVPLPARVGRPDEAEDALEVLVTRPVPGAGPRSPRAPTATGRVRRRAPVHRYLRRDPHAVRRGVVLMTVLGPCRAESPYRSPEDR